MPQQRWKIVGMDDFSNYSRTDILWRNSTNGQNALWFMNGTTVTGFAVLDSMTDQSWDIVAR
jgi:predicted acetyltransferase